MATIQYARLYPDTTQLQAKDGHNLTAGWVEVYLAGTDDPAVTYADFNGTRNPQRIVVDDNGRFCAIVDKSKAYRVEVYDAEGMLQWTTEPVWCTGNAGAGMSVTKVVSTDGSIAVEENIDGSERTYDISIAPSNSDEFLEWIKCSEEDCGSTWYPVYQAGTMETEAGAGIKVHTGQLYHFTNTFYVDPNGSGVNYDTFKVMMYCNDEIVDVRDFDIDSSLNDSVMCEFSTDLIPEADGFVYYKLTIPGTCEVTAEVQCHRIYSGINAVPDTCATKEWVQETFDYNMSGKISYSALEYNGSGYISGISGSAIAGGLDSATVSAIASSYAESAISSISGWSGDFSSISSKVDQSAFDQCCDEVHSALDDKLDKSASGMFQPSSEMSAYVPFSGLEHDNGGKITAISGSGLKGHEYTGVNPVWVDNTEDKVGVYHRTLAVDETMTAYDSGDSAVIGVNTAILSGYAQASSLEDYQLKSAMTAYASVGYVDSGMSGKLDVTASSLFLTSLPADLATTGDVASAVSGKLDNSASGEWYPKTGNPSGFLTAHQSLAGYATEQYVDSSVSGKLDSTAYNSAQFYLTSNPSGFVDAASASAIASAYQVVSSIGTSQAGLTSIVTSINEQRISARYSEFANKAYTDGTGRTISSLPDSAAVSAIASSYAESSVSGKLDASASSDFYSTSNPSGFLTGVDLTPYQLTADMSGYYTTANESGFIDSAYVEGQVSGKQDASAMTAYQPAGNYQPSGDYIYVSALGWAEVN